MVFENGQRNRPTLPEPQPDTLASPTPPSQPPPAPAEVPQPVQPPPVVEPPPPPPVVEQPPEAPSVPAQPLPPVEKTPESVPLPPPLPLPPKPALPKPAVPTPVRRPAVPKPPEFPPPMNYSFGAPVRRPSVQSAPRPPGTVDLSLGPAQRGATNITPHADIDGDNAGPDWRNALSLWVSQHAYYPEQARRDQEQGDAKVHVVAAVNGRVTSVELIGKSGSIWLDLALQALFRGAQIPPLPVGTTEPIEFNFTMHYVLRYR
jgi:protein TonB